MRGFKRAVLEEAEPEIVYGLKRHPEWEKINIQAKERMADLTSGYLTRTQFRTIPIVSGIEKMRTESRLRVSQITELKKKQVTKPAIKEVISERQKERERIITGVISTTLIIPRQDLRLRQRTFITPREISIPRPRTTITPRETYIEKPFTFIRPPKITPIWGGEGMGARKGRARAKIYGFGEKARIATSQQIIFGLKK